MSMDSAVPARENTFLERVQEIKAEYWAGRDDHSERVCVDQLARALARVEAELTAMEVTNRV